MCLSESVFRMRSLRKTLLLAILASALLVLAILHSWPTRAYTTVDVWQRQGLEVEKHLLERFPEADHQMSNVSFHVRDYVARYWRVSGTVPARQAASADVFPSAPPQLAAA